ncbi:MAG TPA: MFS transporter [Candidatus Angelobacter sp.]|nr:MFS transporter [Candidatus Angelobacter sp.]
MSQRRAVLLATTLGSAVVFLDGTIVNVALDPIGRDLPATLVGRLEGLTYVTTAYFTVLSALLILAGALNDYYGRRRMFVVGLLGFGVASVGCGLAPTMELLIGGRILQAVFGALLVPGSLSIITATFDGEERGRAIGLWAAGTSATLIVGPLLGGLLVQAVSWRMAFLINVPIIALVLWAARSVPESRDEDARGEFDWLGAFAIAVAVGGLAFGATRGQQQNWNDPVAWAALAVGAVATIAVPILMVVRPRPLVPPQLFRSRNFTVVNLATLLVYGALYVSMGVQNVFFQGTLGYSPLAAGATLMPTAVLLTFLSTPAGRIAARVGPRLFLTLGPIVMAAGILWLARIPAGSAAWDADLARPASMIPPVDAIVDVLLPLVVFGIGISMLVAPLTTALMSSIPVRHAGLGSAINNAISRVGQPLVFAVLFIAVTASFYAALEGSVPALDVNDPAVRAEVQPLTALPPGLDPEIADAARIASTGAFRLAMLVSAGLLLAGALVSGIGLRDRPPRATRDP